MKKTLLIIAIMAFLVSCAKSVEVIDKDQTETAYELTISSITNSTKAITEGTEMPKDNIIEILPNFHSDINTADYSGANVIGTFGYDRGLGVWRNLDADDPAHFLPTVFGVSYNFSPLFWPAGDRVFMDYVACSYNYLLPQAKNILVGYFEENPMDVETARDNSNRMSIRYEYNMPEDIFFHTEFPGNMGVFPNFLPIVKQLGYETGIEDSVLEEYNEDFLQKFYDSINYIRNAVENDEDYDLPTDSLDALNRCYWLYMNYYPVIHKVLQDDLLYAHDKNIKNDNHGSVKAVFNHAKSWIKVIVNNQTQNDLFISDIRFDDVQSNGTLVIDNSKAEFETYWNFPSSTTTIGASISPYDVVPLGGDEPLPTEPTEDEAPQTPGLIPDLYLVPAGCYGPALSIDKGWFNSNAQPTDSVDFLKFKYLNGGQLFSIDKNDCRTMVGRLSGMMFPAQEPGKISIKYKSWKHVEAGFAPAEDYNTQMLPMHLAVETLAGLDESSNHQVTLNLPRQIWQMGKVYVYVITIAEDEITINPHVTEWEYAAPIIGPEETGLRTDESTETLIDGNTNNWFNED